MIGGVKKGEISAFINAASREEKNMSEKGTIPLIQYNQVDKDWTQGIEIRSPCSDMGLLNNCGQI